MNGLFFTGTDTGVGKTYVVAAVARLLRQHGRAVGVCKPVATGAERIDGRWVSADTLRLAQAAGLGEAWERVTPYVFAEAVAPAVAARLHGTPLSIAALADAVRSRHEPGNLLLVEGVGGLLCPLTERETVADLAAALRLPIIVVARRSLGTLNHTLLTLEAAQRRGLPVAGLVVSETTRPVDLADETNVEELRRRIAVPLLAVVPYQTEEDREQNSALAAVDWWRLGHADSSEEHVDLCRR